MKKLLPLLALTALLWTAEARAQTYDLQFVPEVRDDTLALRVQIRLQDGTAPLGLATLKFNYDSTALSFPGFPEDSVDYRYFAFDGDQNPAEYAPATATRPTNGSISLNITPANFPFPQSSGTNVGTTFMDVAEVYLAILDPNATADFSWDTTTNTFVSDAVTQATWTKGNLTTTTDVELPVELVNFAVQANGPAVQLSWTTASETNNAGFDVQYALPDSARFVSAGFVDGHGTTSEAQAYAFQFKPERLGTYRVRLKQVDFDGAFSYSPEVEVAVTQLTGAEDGQPVAYTLSQAAPNPFRNTSTLTLQMVTGQQVRAMLYNALGQQVQTVFDAYVPGGGSQTLVVEGADLSPGLYVLQVKGEKFAETRQLVLVR